MSICNIYREIEESRGYQESVFIRTYLTEPVRNGLL